MSFKEVLADKTEQINGILLQYLPKEEGHRKTLLAAMNYSMLAGGKRLRPMLMRETFELFGGQGRVIEPFMAGMEMIHTHSLVHDDLPAMDNDDYRRGRKTTHVVFGEGMAILAGDALLNYAYETISRAFETGTDPALTGKALAVLARKTGIDGMIGGQSVDVELEGKDLNEEQLLFIHRLKTGALIEGSMMIGAILAGAGDEEIRIVEQIASDVGMAFQIQDDILDVTGTMQELGKPVHSDEKNHKTTYVTVYGLEKAAADVEFYSRRAVSLLDSLPVQNDFLRELLIYLIRRDN